MTTSNKFKKHIYILTFLFLALFTFLPTINVFATDSSTIVETTFFGNLQDDGKGCGVYTVLNTVVDILSIGVGILGVVGITIVGIQYLTAGSNEQQTAKAKRRMAEIVVGLIAYAALYAFMQWLLPGGKLNTTTCQTVTDQELADIRAQEQAKRQAAQQGGLGDAGADTATLANGETIKLSPQIAKMYTPEKFAKLINRGKIAPSPVCTDCKWSERIAETAELLSWPESAKPKKYHWTYSEAQRSKFKSWSDLTGGRPNPAHQKAIDGIKPTHGFTDMTTLGADCGMFVGYVVRYSGLDRKSIYNCPTAIEYYSKSDLWKKVSKAKRGDVCVQTGCHTRIYLGDGLVAEANHHGQNFGHITTGGCSSYTIFRAVGK